MATKAKARARKSSTQAKAETPKTADQLIDECLSAKADTFNLAAFLANVDAADATEGAFDSIVSTLKDQGQIGHQAYNAIVNRILTLARAAPTAMDAALILVSALAAVIVSDDAVASNDRRRLDVEYLSRMLELEVNEHLDDKEDGEF